MNAGRCNRARHQRLRHFDGWQHGLPNGQAVAPNRLLLSGILAASRPWRWDKRDPPNPPLVPLPAFFVATPSTPGPLFFSSRSDRSSNSLWLATSTPPPSCHRHGKLITRSTTPRMCRREDEREEHWRRTRHGGWGHLLCGTAYKSLVLVLPRLFVLSLLVLLDGTSLGISCVPSDGQRCRC